MTDQQMAKSASILRLEQLVPAHACELFAGLSDPALYLFIDEVAPASVGALRARYEQLVSRRSPDRSQVWLNWAIWSPADHAYVGVVQATVGLNQVAEVAYILFRSFWGRGYARAAVAKMIKLVRDNHDILTFLAHVDARHFKSRAMLEVLGFRCVRIRRDAERIHGQLTDEAEYLLEVATS